MVGLLSNWPATFFFAWIPLIIAGRQNLFSLETYLINYANNINKSSNIRYRSRQIDLDRRRFLTSSTVYTAVGALLIAGGSFIFGRLMSSNTPPQTSNTLNLSNQSHAPSSTGTGSTSPSTSTPTQTPQTTVSGSEIGPASQVAIGKIAAFTDPISGDPAYVLHLSSNKFVAFDAVCPHAGCTVQPYLSQSIFQCPCHGSQFDLSTGQVISGPASSNLTQLNLAISDGIIYVTDWTEPFNSQTNLFLSYE